MRVAIRAMEPQDLKFIFASWLNNYKDCSYFAKQIRRSTFFAKHHAIIEHILAKPATKVMVATTSTDRDQILGFLCFEDAVDGQVIHYAFVKSAFQRLGIAKQMFRESGIDLENVTFTHHTFMANEIMNNRPGVYNYDPYRL